jgi:molybdopterin-containing oxidoreductase family iron-sulfur binding subunit
MDNHDNNENEKKNNTSEYWQDVENQSLEGINLKEEFLEGTYPQGMAQHSRRDFLKTLGFSLSVTSIAACTKIPPKKVIPFLRKNDQIIPGVADWYATTCQGCSAHCSLLVKTREGRPIKVEGNEMSPHNRGGVCPYAQGGLLSLYDSFRIQTATANGQTLSWEAIDAELIKKLREVEGQNKKIVLITNTLRSPSTLELIKDFQKTYKQVTHISYAPYEVNSILDAQEMCFGERGFPALEIKKAKLIVGFSADFLGTWGASVAQTKDYSERRDLFKSKDIIRHIQVEQTMSLTGSNADTRVRVSLDEENAFIQNILVELQKDSLKTLVPNVTKLPVKDTQSFNKILAELKANRSTSIVVSGSRDKTIQVYINAINELLGNWGKTIYPADYSYSTWANDSQMENFVESALKGEVGAAVFWDVNPGYDYYDTKKFADAVAKIPVSVSFSLSPDETSTLCHYVMPSLHPYEAWGDFEVEKGLYSFSQPLLRTFFYSRQEQDALLKWMGREEDYHDFIQKFWKQNMFSKVGAGLTTFELFWDKSIHDGVVKTVEYDTKKSKKFILKGDIHNLGKADGNLIHLNLYQKVGLRSGKFAGNPWLQEMPDPITKATWDNYLQISPLFAKDKTLKNGDVVVVKTKRGEIKVPVLVQPGLDDKTVALALGYGRRVCGKGGKDVGVNAYPLMHFENGNYVDGIVVDDIQKTTEHHELGLTQTHHSMEGRDIVKEGTLAEYINDPSVGNKSNAKLVSMWSEHAKNGEQWAMLIDLNKCTGCSGCVISCSAENNVPVVGRQEVINRREMHWIRLDRYYKGDESNPEVVHQPVMCMHCENAPCETVCPVLATVHSSDGLNQQVYNRCVGTRYCANNCPYKVRRFNWFDYAHDDKYANMVLNPDIVVRSRGVMEKCSMCIQRIQEGKLQAKKEGRELKDGDIKLACQQSCPADAITFGDMNDKESEIAKKLKDPRYYRLLEELNVAPRVGFLTKIRNK